MPKTFSGGYHARLDLHIFYTHVFGILLQFSTYAYLQCVYKQKFGSRLLKNYKYLLYSKNI